MCVSEADGRRTRKRFHNFLLIQFCRQTPVAARRRRQAGRRRAKTEEPLSSRPKSTRPTKGEFPKIVLARMRRMHARRARCFTLRSVRSSDSEYGSRKRRHGHFLHTLATRRLSLISCCSNCAIFHQHRRRRHRRRRRRLRRRRRRARPFMFASSS